MTKQIPLRGKFGQGKFALVDDEDYPLLSRYRWYVMKNGYVVCNQQARSALSSRLMHRVIMQAPRELQVDHKFGNKLDNRRDNLRLATPTNNQQNSSKPHYKERETSSRYKGVHWDNGRRCWVAVITIDYLSKNLGNFVTEREAAHAYNEAALQYFGEYAKPNEIDDTPEESVVRTFGPLGDNPYRGVRWHYNKWQAWIFVDGKFINFGDYDDPKEAAKAYDRAVLRYRGRNSLFNLPDYIKTITNPDAPILVKATSRSHAKYPYRGVTPASKGRWKGRITINGARRVLGIFDTQEEAARAVDRAELTKVSLFYKLNFPEDYDENTLPPGKWPNV